MKYPALNPLTNLKSRRDDIVDVMSYMDQLSEKDKAWMNKFMEEYNNAEFSKNNDKNIMKTTEEKRTSYNRNNARNRDVYNRLKMNNDLVFIEDITLKDDVGVKDEENED